jgi:hypothetical protein
MRHAETDRGKQIFSSCDSGNDGVDYVKENAMTTRGPLILLGENALSSSAIHNEAMPPSCSMNERACIFQ